MRSCCRQAAHTLLSLIYETRQGMRYTISEEARTELLDRLLALAHTPHHVVTLASVEDDALGEELQVVWKRELGAEIIEQGALPAPHRFDPPPQFTAFLDAAQRAAEPMLGLVGTKEREPEVPLSTLKTLAGPPSDATDNDSEPPFASEQLMAFLKEQTGRSESALRNALSTSLSGHALNRLRVACDNDDDVFQRVRPFATLVRWDTFEQPVVITAVSPWVREARVCPPASTPRWRG